MIQRVCDICGRPANEQEWDFDHNGRTIHMVVQARYCVVRTGHKSLYEDVCQENKRLDLCPDCIKKALE